MTSPARAKGPVHRWLDDHDERWTFMLLYIGGSVLLSIFANLFWVAMMVVTHFMLELFRHRTLKPGLALCHALWHLKLDIALIFFAMVLSLYGDMIFAALGLGQAARAAHAMRGMQMATRVAVLERGIRVFLLTLDDMARVTRAVLKIAAGKKNAVTAPANFSREDFTQGRDTGNGPFSGPAFCEEEAESATPWREPGGGDIFALCFGALCLLLVLGAPVLRGQPVDAVWAAIGAQMTP